MVTNLLPSREEASTVFGDPRSLTIPDPVHLKLAPFPTRSLLPSQFYLLCRFPKRSIVSRSLPLGSTATLAALPAMSLFPDAPFGLSVCPSMSLSKPREAEVIKCLPIGVGRSYHRKNCGGGCPVGLRLARIYTDYMRRTKRLVPFIY